MVDDDQGGPAEPGEDELPIEAGEREAAEAMARALDERGVGGRLSALDAEAVGLIRVAAGGEPPLGEVKARSLARAAVATAIRRAALRGQRRRRTVAWAGMAAAALLVVLGGGRLVRPVPSLPEELCSRPAGMLVPGPFPPQQGPADRLDKVTEARLVALRDLRLRALGGGRR